MTVHLDCPVDGCRASIEGDTEESVLSQAEAHAAEAHPDVEMNDETVSMIKSNIREV
jgi:predicted small metal-binding protein